MQCKELLRSVSGRMVYMTITELIKQLKIMVEEDCNKDATVYINGNSEFTIDSSYLDSVEIEEV